MKFDEEEIEKQKHFSNSWEPFCKIHANRRKSAIIFARKYFGEQCMRDNIDMWYPL